MFFRLWTRAPRTAIQSCAIVLLPGSRREPQFTILRQALQDVVGVLTQVWGRIQWPDRQTKGCTHGAQAQPAGDGATRGNVKVRKRLDRSIDWREADVASFEEGRPLGLRPASKHLTHLAHHPRLICRLRKLTGAKIVAADRVT